MKTSMPKNDSRPAGTVSVSAWTVLLVLLVGPIYALSQLSTALDWRALMAGLALLSAATFFVYRSDKRRAETGAWRIPETTLHLMALLGGWPGAFLAQRRFRHKTSKTSFQIAFWAIVLVHQFLAAVPDRQIFLRLGKPHWRGAARSARRHTQTLVKAIAGVVQFR
jgi:uncharacterized membrane protein YsdA (DUF1294 family)